MTRGLDCNNPMNLMISTASWKGKATPTRDPQRRLETFDTVVNGIRAGALTVINYKRFRGIDTLRGIITRFAPSVENPTSAYIDFLCDHTGFDADAHLEIQEKASLLPVVTWIIAFEQGPDAHKVTPEQIDTGVSLALKTADV